MSIFSKLNPVNWKGKPSRNTGQGGQVFLEKARNFGSTQSKEEFFTRNNSTITSLQASLLGFGDRGNTRAVALYQIRRWAATNPFIQGYMGQAVSEVVGPNGVRPTFSSVDSERHRKTISSLWESFQENPSITGDSNFVELLGGALSAMLTDGMAFFIIEYDETNDDYPNGMALRPVGREFFAESYDDHSQNIAGGIKFSERGTILGYYFHRDVNDIVKQASANQQTTITNVHTASSNPIFVPVSRVIKLSLPQRHDDWDRSPSWLIPSLSTLSQINSLDDSTLESMKDASKRRGIIKYLNDDMVPEVFSDANATKEDKAEAAAEFRAQIEKGFGASAGEWIHLLPGADVTLDNPSHPSHADSNYRKELLRGSASSLQVDYPSFSSDPGDANFGSIRYFANITRNNWRRLQKVMERKVVRPVLVALIDYHSRPGGRLSRIGKATLADAKATPFQAKVFQWVDPMKDAQVRKMLVEMGVMSIKDVASELGLNVEETLKENTALADQMTPEVVEKLKTVFASLPAFSKSLQEQPDDNEDGNDDNGNNQDNSGSTGS